MAAYRRVYDSRHLQADCQEPGSAPGPYTLCNRVWATFTFFTVVYCGLGEPQWPAYWMEAGEMLRDDRSGVVVTTSAGDCRPAAAFCTDWRRRR